MKKYRIRVVYPGYGNMIVDMTVEASLSEQGRFWRITTADGKNHYYPTDYTIIDEV